MIIVIHTSAAIVIEQTIGSYNRMRRSRVETAETRRRIVDVAAAAIRRKGIAGAGLADLMSEAGLTHGGFYRHFTSKDQLVAEAITAAGGATAGMMRAHHADPGPTSAAAGAMAAYLSSEHRDDPARGCPLAALGPEIARADLNTRVAATEEYLRLLALISGPGARKTKARQKAMTNLSTMVGALILSRMVADDALSDEILAQARAHLAVAAPRENKTMVKSGA